MPPNAAARTRPRFAARFRLRQEALASEGHGPRSRGLIRSPLWRHGGTTHGPVPRSYDYKIPKKMILGALKSALSAKLRDGEMTVVNEFALSDHKTKTVHAASAS